MKKILLTSFACLSLVSCGFTPMYGTGFNGGEGVDIRTDLSHVQIDNVKDREGQYLRNALIDRFYIQGRPSQVNYILSIADIEESRSDLDITKSSDATRAQLRVTTSMTLTDANTNEVVLERALKSITSFNVLTSEFATRVSEQAARENTLNDIARQIELQIGLYLKRSK
ncbi:MAG: LPS assembly lipoprotein LptE [Alphaproteobacteria bacterium]